MRYHLAVPIKWKILAFALVVVLLVVIFVALLQFEASVTAQPGFLDVKIFGPLEIGINNTSTYTAFVGNFLSGSFSYSWSISPKDNNTLFVCGGGECNLTFIRAQQETYTLMVNVRDNVTGNLGEASVEVGPYMTCNMHFDSLALTPRFVVETYGKDYRVIDGTDGSLIVYSSHSADETLNFALASGGVIAIRDGNYTGAKLVVSSNAIIAANKGVIGIKYASIGDGAMIDEPNFSNAFGEYNGGSFTIVRNSTGFATDATWYLAFKPDNSIYFVSTNETYVEQRALAAMTSGVLQLNEVAFDTSLTTPANISVMQILNNRTTFYPNKQLNFNHINKTIYPSEGISTTNSNDQNSVNYKNMLVPPKIIDYMNLNESLVYGFEDAGKWVIETPYPTCAITNDTENYREGSGAIRFTYNDTYLFAHTSINPVNMTNRHFVLRIYVPDPSQLRYNRVLFRTPTSSKYFTFTFGGLNAGWNTAGINRLSVVPAGGANDSDWQNITAIKIQFIAALGITSTNVTLAGLTTVLDIPGRGYVTLRFDDSYKTDYTVAAVKMSSYGYAGVELVITSDVDRPGRLSLAQMNAMKNFGWDLVSHSLNHQYFVVDNIPLSQAEYELSASQKWLVDNGFDKGARIFAPPGNNWNSTYMQLIQKYYFACYTQDSGYGGYATYPPQDLYRLGLTISVDSNTTIDAINTILDNAGRYGYWVTLYFHDPGKVPIFDAILSTIHSRSSTLRVVTVSDILDITYSPSL